MARLSIGLVLAAYAAGTSAKFCRDLTVPVTVSARNGKFNLKPATNNIEVSDFVLNMGKRGANYSQELLEDIVTVSGTYSIAATYCQPTQECPGQTLQILTHGIGFDRSYWDFPYNNYNYSYVNTALERGYSTFSYDRFGVGQSQHGDPIDEVQSFLEIAILEGLTEQLRESKVDGIDASFKKTVHVGHSFGSMQSFALSRNRPELSDGLVLTGFSFVPEYMPYFLFGGNLVSVKTLPALATKYDEGYIAPQSSVGVNQNFFASKNFDPEILEPTFNAGQPLTFGEFLTIGPVASSPTHFTGPAFIITGDYDIPFCGGNCSTPTGDLLESASDMFPNTTNLETFIVPRSGHGLNFEYTAPITFGKIHDFLESQKL